jgi:hypothetical protein
MPRILDDENHQDLVPWLGVGPWQTFPADPGWNSTLRYRRVPGGLQMDGQAYGPLPANQLQRVGMLPAAVRPEQTAVAPILVLTVPAVFSVGAWIIYPDGSVWTQWPVAGSSSEGALVNLVIALD